MGITNFISNSVSQYSLQLSKREKCVGSKQQCQLPTDSTSDTTTIVVAVVVPVVVIFLFLSFFVWRNYKKGKEESLEDDDPDFNGDNTILPDIDMNYYEGGTESKFAKTDGNPFEAGELRYPSNVYSNQPRGASPYNQSSFFNNDNRSVTNTVNAARYVDSFVLPYGEQTGSKRSLDEFARGIGSTYTAYAPAESDHSRASSLTRSVHPFSRSTDMLSKTNLSQVVSTDDTKNSSDVTELKEFSPTEEKIEVTSTSSANDDQFEDTHSQIQDQSSRPTSAPSVSTANLVKQLDDNAAAYDRSPDVDNRASYVSNGHEQLSLKESEPTEEFNQATSKEDEDLDDPSLDPEEREKLRRLKSIYNVYFDRENSIKHQKKGANEQVVLPPLPALPSNVTPNDDNDDRDEEELGPNLNINTDFDRTYASSVYPENPLNDYEPYQQHLLQQQQLEQQQYQYQQHPYPQQQYPQQYSQQYQQQQYAYNTSQQRRIPHQHQQQPRMKQPLSKLSNLPAPSELNQRPYSSLNFYTDYQPKSTFKASSSPRIDTPQGFNPMDQWSESGEPSANLTPTAISRNSVAMTNPTAIAKSRLYQPAGSLAVAARNSPQIVQSPTFGGNQSPVVPGSGMVSPTSVDSNYGPPGGSKQDLRNYMGSYNNV